MSDAKSGKLLSGLLGVDEEHKEQKTHQVICPTCRTTYEEFIKNSRFGCLDCYGVFDLLISENIKQLQGSDTHKGKHPRYHSGQESRSFSLDDLSEDGAGGSIDVKEQLRILDARLHEAIAREEYEAAARYRDKIRELKEGIEKC